MWTSHDPRLLEAIAGSGVTIECSLTCNVVLGAVASHEEHPIRRFLYAGIAVTLCVDNPVQFCTTIGRGYALAYALGFTLAGLLDFTRNAVSASFMPTERKRMLLARLHATSPASTTG